MLIRLLLLRKTHPLSHITNLANNRHNFILKCSKMLMRAEILPPIIEASWGTWVTRNGATRDWNTCASVFFLLVRTFNRIRPVESDGSFPKGGLAKRSAALCLRCQSNVGSSELSCVSWPPAGLWDISLVEASSSKVKMSSEAPC